MTDDLRWCESAECAEHGANSAKDLHTHNYTKDPNGRVEGRYVAKLER